MATVYDKLSSIQKYSFCYNFAQFKKNFSLKKNRSTNREVAQEIVRCSDNHFLGASSSALIGT